MDPGLCREHLAELLGEEIVLLTELQQLLEEERDTIGGGQPEALQRSTAARQERLGALANRPIARGSSACGSGVIRPARSRRAWPSAWGAPCAVGISTIATDCWSRRA